VTTVALYIVEFGAAYVALWVAGELAALAFRP
jgi:hypothetical protein